MGRYELRDFEWTDQAASSQQAAACGAVDHRRVLNGIFQVLRSGAPWPDVPPRL